MKVLLVAFAIAGVFSRTAGAQTLDPRVEVGTTLATLAFTFDTNSDSTVLSVPSGTFNLQPALYASIFVSPYVAIEPQFGLIWASSNGDSTHALVLSGQADLFVRGTTVSSPYVFASVGTLDYSGSGKTPTLVAGGVGYRALAGDRLTFRFDTRFTHLTDGAGNILALSITIGGVFQ